MKKLILFLAAAMTYGLSSVQTSSAQSAQFVFTPVSGVDNAAPGSSITFSINLVFTGGGSFTDIQGLTYYLQQNGAAPFVFTLTGRDLGASPFDDPTTPNPAAIGNGPALNASNDTDLGATAANPLGDSTYFVANITLSISGTAAAQSYTIQSTDSGNQFSRIFNSNGDDLAIQAGSLTVTVVPEPSSIALLAFASAGFAIIAYGRRAVS